MLLFQGALIYAAFRYDVVIGCLVLGGLLFADGALFALSDDDSLQ